MNISLSETLSIETANNQVKSSTKPRRSWKEFIQRKNGVRVYVCNSSGCGKEFNYLSSLVKHERIHRGERPYTCKVCNQSFVQSSNLKRHEKTHTGEKTYECTHCIKKFSTSSNLRQHLQIHNEDTQRKHYDCHQCGRTYLYPSSLSKHSKFCDGASKSDISDKTDLQDNRIEDPIIKKMVKIEETLSTQRTQSETLSMNTLPISPIETKQSPAVHLQKLEFLFNNYPLTNSISASLPLLKQQQPIINYPLVSCSNTLFNNLLMQRTYNPFQTVQQQLNNTILNSTPLQMSNLTHPLYLRQQLQNNIRQQAALALAVKNSLPFY